MNGVSIPLTATFGPPVISGQLFNVSNLFIGRRQPADTVEGPSAAVYYQGLIDEVQLYNRALSASEIQAIFSA